jgi:hypothetical protein
VKSPAVNLADQTYPVRLIDRATVDAAIELAERDAPRFAPLTTADFRLDGYDEQREFLASDKLTWGTG